MNTEQTLALTNKYLLPTYSRLPIALVKGQDRYLFDAEGRRYLDFMSGIAVTSCGHCHPQIVQALQKQAEELMHCSNLFLIPNQALLAEKLCQASGLQKAFFCNSGAEAAEAAIKLARKWGRNQKNGAFEIIVARDSFHGRTLGALSATAQSKYQEPFRPLVPGFKSVPFGDSEALRAAVSEQTAAIMLEPLQGEGGVHPAPNGYLETAADLAQSENLLLILDEVQTGLGRIGKMFAFQHSQIQPDLVTLAKALGGGVPIGAILAGKKAVSVFQPGDHASTFGGSPLITAAALAAVEVLQNGLIEQCARVGSYFKQQLLDWAQKEPRIKEVRGLGLLLGVELQEPAAPIVAAARGLGLLILTAGEKTLRFAPPLVIEENDVKTALQIMEAAFAEVC